MKNSLTFWIAIILLVSGLAACGGGSSSTTDGPTPPPPPPGSSIPADTYFSLAITENSHNHTGARLLFLDFQDTTPITSVIQNNVVISPKVPVGTITMDGNATEWDASQLTTVNGLPQNNYPLSEFIDAVPTDITVGSAWDDDYIYFMVQWHDAGNNQSTKYKKWFFGDQGGGESGWNPLTHVGTTNGAPNDGAVNRLHTLLGAENEDRVLMMFPITDSQNNFSANGLGCAAYCHTNLAQGSPYQNYTGYGLVAMHTNVPGDRADIWHWKSSRTAPSNRADDKHLVYAVGSDNGRASDSGVSAYADNSLIDGHPEFMHSDGLGYPGDVLTSVDSIVYAGTPIPNYEVPASISSIPTGSRGDVETRSNFNASTNVWTVEFRRLRNTGNNDDRQFNFGGGMTPPATAAVVAGNATSGATLYNANCETPCHRANGSGEANGAGWGFPRIQRASGSLIRKALQTVSFMQSISLTDQQVEDIAAYLQTQVTDNAVTNLSVSIAGGVTGNNIISSDPAGVSCPGKCDFDFVDSGVITLTASYVPDFTFTGWSVTACGNSLTCDVTLATDPVVIATYTANATTYTLDITKTGNGTVSSVPAGIDCGADCTENYTAGNTITLTAVPNPGYQFDSWSGGGCSGTGSCIITITADTTVTANFSLITATPTCANGALTFDANGTNGIGRQMMINANSVSNPTDMAFIPGSSNAFLVTAQSGTVSYFNNACAPTNSINLRSIIGIVNVGTEEGLLNVEFHPQYATNHYVFFYHTSVASSVNSISRMTVSFDGLGNLQLTDPVKIIDFHKVGSAGNHNGGGLLFAPDNTLLASVGDGGSGSSSNAQVNTNLLGAVIRITPSLTVSTGGYNIPSGNMFNSANTQCTSTSANADPCPEILAMGLRNPYRMSIDGNIIYLGDVGNSYEEINSFDYTVVDNSTPVNFGWPTHDGPVGSSAIPGYMNPILAYQRGDATAAQFRTEDPACASDPGCDGTYASLMIGDVYRGTLYGGDLTGRLLHAEFMDGFIRAVSVNAAGATTDTGIHVIHHDGISAMIQGPDDYIYLVTQQGAWGTGDADMVYRLVRP